MGVVISPQTTHLDVLTYMYMYADPIRIYNMILLEMKKIIMQFIYLLNM